MDRKRDYKEAQEMFFSFLSKTKYGKAFKSIIGIDYWSGFPSTSWRYRGR